MLSSSFTRPAGLNQQVRVSGGTNTLFKESLHGLRHIIDFINVQRQQGGYINLNDKFDDAIVASTPLMTEPGRVFFASDPAEIPDNLEASDAMRYLVLKGKALYLEDNNIEVSRRVFFPDNE
jgi:hypothetical protein